MKHRFEISDTPEATVISSIATNSGAITSAEVSRKETIDRSAVSRITADLFNKGWIHKVAKTRPPRGRPASLLATTALFEDTFQEVTEKVYELPHDKTELFESGLQAYSDLQDEAIVDPDRQEAAIRYLGTTALLAEQYDLKDLTDGDWYSGVPGWRSLTVIRHNRIDTIQD